MLTRVRRRVATRATAWWVPARTAAAHGAAVALIESADAPFLVSDVAVIEVVFALCRHYEFSRVAAAEAIEGLMSLTQIDCNRVMFKRALPFSPITIRHRSRIAAWPHTRNYRTPNPCGPSIGNSPARSIRPDWCRHKDVIHQVPICLTEVKSLRLVAC